MGMVSTLAESASLVAAVAIATKKDIPITDVITDKRKRSALITNGSITRLLGDLIITPVIRITESLRNHEYIEKAIHMNLDLFVSIYTRAYMVLVSQKGFEPDDALRLLSSKKERLLGEINELVGESLLDDLDSLPISGSIEITGENSINHNEMYKDRTLYIREIELTINLKDKDNEDKGATIKQYIIVRGIVEYVPSSSLELLVKSHNKIDKSFWAAWHRYKSGEDSLKDLIFGTKLLEEEKKARLMDDKDLIRELHEREDDANRMLLTEGVVGFGKYYMMLIIDKATKIRLENAIKEKIEKERGKNLLLNTIKAMSVTVMNDDYDMAVTYLESLPGSLDITYKSLKKKDKDDDLKEVLKLLASRS